MSDLNCFLGLMVLSMIASAVFVVAVIYVGVRASTDIWQFKRRYEWTMQYGTEEQKQTILLEKISRDNNARGAGLAWFLFHH